MEFIGFIISFLALLYLYFKQQSSVQHQQEQAGQMQEAEIEEEDPLKEFMKEMRKRDREQQEVRRPPPPPKPQLKQPKHQHRKNVASPLEEYRISSSIEKRQLKSTLEERKLIPKVGGRFLPHHEGEDEKRGPSKGKLDINRLANRRDLLIYQEIMDKPKSMRPSP